MLLPLLLIQGVISLSILTAESSPSCTTPFSLSRAGCSIGTIQCVNIYGEPILDRRSRFYQNCATGRWSETMLAPDDKICYMGSLFPSSFCGGLPPQPECSFSGYQCVNDDNILTSTECTSK